MKRKTVGMSAVLCAIIIFGCIFSGCSSSDAAPETEPVTLAEQIEDFAVDIARDLEDRGMSVEEISERSPAAGYLASLVLEYRGFICVPDAEGPDGFAYMYDNAAAIIALTDAGADWYARKIADAIVYAMEHDRTFDDGRLRNAYLGGDPAGDNGWSFINGEKAVKLAGQWIDEQWQEDYYASSTSTGNVAWAVLALCYAAQNAEAVEAEEYIAAAEKAAGFLLNLRSDSGGFTAGYEGWDDVQVQVTYKSTEHNIDLIIAFSALAEAVRGINPEKAEEYTAASDHAKTFVLSMYNTTDNYFYTGTQNDGVTVSRGVLPLDANTWAILALGDDFPDAELTMAFVEENMAVGEGFDFSAGDLDGVWHEGTAQMAVCYKLLGNTASYDRVMTYLATQTAPDGSITAADSDGVSTGFYVSGTTALWEYNNTTNLGATNWLAFAQLGVNPFKSPSVSSADTSEPEDG